MHVAKALIYDADGNILVLRRSGTHPNYAYQSDFPGGTIESDEDIITGLIREIQEESNISIGPELLQPAFIDRIVGDWTRHLYTATLPQVKPTVVISWEHDQYEWLPTNHILQKPLQPETDSYYIDAIAWLKENA